MHEQLRYINQIAPKIAPTEEFQKEFLEITGKTMAEYKSLVKSASSWNFWQKETAQQTIQTGNLINHFSPK